jgi:PAS domain S-box-containing protein
MDDPHSAASAEETRGEDDANTRQDVSWPVVGTDTAAGLLEAAPDAILGVDRTGEIALANLQVEELFGYTRDELIGRPVEMLVPPGARDRHRGHGRATRPRRVSGRWARGRSSGEDARTAASFRSRSASVL